MQYYYNAHNQITHSSIHLLYVLILKKKNILVSIFSSPFHILKNLHFIVERSSSVVECRSRNRESPGSNPLCYRFEVWAFSFTSRRLSRLSCINEYLALDSGGNVSDLVLARNCCLARMLPGEAENGVGMNRSVREGKTCKAL